jgi:hypothetical protein
MLSLPQDIELPFFAYGAFKPGELAYTQIERFLGDQAVQALAKGRLLIRDGLPLFDDEGSGSISGWLLTFSAENCRIGYEAICNFEPKAIYFWEKTTLSSPPVVANVLKGKMLTKGRPQDFEKDSWSFDLDPVFQYGLKAVEEISNQLGQESFAAAPPESFDWPRFFRLQMAYLLLWSAIERFASFAYGPGLRPEQKIICLGADIRFISAIEKHLPSESQEVSDSRDPSKKSHLDLAHPEEAADYFYQVRCNLSHRGKGAWLDGEIVRESLLILLGAFKEMLSSHKSIPK